MQSAEIPPFSCFVPHFGRKGTEELQNFRICEVPSADLFPTPPYCHTVASSTAAGAGDYTTTAAPLQHSRGSSSGASVPPSRLSRVVCVHSCRSVCRPQPLTGRFLHALRAWRTRPPMPPQGQDLFYMVRVGFVLEKIVSVDRLSVRARALSFHIVTDPEFSKCPGGGCLKEVEDCNTSCK